MKKQTNNIKSTINVNYCNIFNNVFILQQIDAFCNIQQKFNILQFCNLVSTKIKQKINLSP